MNTQQIEDFFVETTKTFHFLETQYKYQLLERDVQNPNDIRDAIAQVRYAGSHVGVRIEWYFANAVIDVSFVEFLQPGVFPQSISVFPFKDRPTTAKAISLYYLAEMLGHNDDPDFLLKKPDNLRIRNKRQKVIDGRMHDILIGLSHATQIYSKSILQGDTSIFLQVMKFYVAKHKQIYPDMSLPPGVIDDPS